MNTDKKQKKLAMLLIAVVAITIITLNVLQITFIAATTSKITRNTYEEECIELTKSYTSRISAKMEEYYGLLYTYTTNDVVQTKDNTKIIEWLRDHQNIRHREFDYIAWVDLDGNFDSDIGNHTSVKDRSYYKDIVELGKETTVDDPVSSKSTGKTVIHICRAAKVDGQLLGFFCAVMEEQTYKHLMDGIKFGNTGVGSIVTSMGQIIATSGDKNSVQEDINFINSQPDIKDFVMKSIAEQKSEFSFWSKNARGSRSFVSSADVAGTPWGFSFIIDSTQINQTADELRLIMIIAGSIVGVILSAIVGIFVYISLKPLNIVESTIKGIATGNADLTKRIRINAKQNNEISGVVNSFNQFTAKLQDIMQELKTTKNELVNSGNSMDITAKETVNAITQISTHIESISNNINSQNSSVNQTATAVNEIASNIESLNHMINGQADSVEQAAAAIEQMIANINSVTGSVEKMADSFINLQKNAQNGVDKQKNVNEFLIDIQNESKTLQEANAVISNIAEQTNLLAMNAAIEAAHAGEAGRGFAVVADEIRKLSETSTNQSNRIGEQLNNIVQTINGIVLASQQTGIAFDSIFNGIRDTDNIVRQIKAAMEEQNEGSKQITGALNNMNNSTSEVKSASFEMSEGNKSILQEIQKLQDATISLRHEMEEIASGANTINEAGNTLNNVAQEVKESINKIGNQVDLFKV